MTRVKHIIHFLKLLGYFILSLALIGSSLFLVYTIIFTLPILVLIFILKCFGAV